LKTLLNATDFQNKISHLVSDLCSFSLVNSDGQLLFSKDLKTDYLTTTRLVAFQIVKKYLQPKPLDLFILNDPENGGFSLTKIIFVTALHGNLYLIWNEENPLVNFKIPPTPLYEKNVKNEFIWKAMIETNENAVFFKSFFENEKARLDDVISNKNYIEQLSLPKNQNVWLKATQEIFDLQLANKAYGSFECSAKVQNNQMIKLKLTSEEKQNIKMITLDFTSTGPALTYSSASHVVESGLIQKIIQFYQIEKFFSQSILDKIKVILPPKSIVSKSHPTGEWNLEIQSICSQLCAYNLLQLNTQTRKNLLNFELLPELKVAIICQKKSHFLSFEQKNLRLEDFEKLIYSKFVQVRKIQRTEHAIHLEFDLISNEIEQLIVKSKLFSEGADYSFRINEKPLEERTYQLKPQDRFEIKWKLV
jgi:hypothetical protein